MNKQITHITISTHEYDQKIGEIAFFDPLGGGGRTAQRALTQHSPFFITHTLFQKGQTLLKQIFFKNVKYFFFSKATSNEERKCKSILALFLSQKNLVDYYLKDQEKRLRFVETICAAAKEMGYTFPPISCESEEDVMDQLLTMSGEKCRILEDKKGWQRYLLFLGHKERERLLHILLTHLERIPLTSLVEVERSGEAISFSMTTYHGKTELSSKELEGTLFCNKHENRSKPMAPLEKHSLSNQHLIFDNSEGREELFCSLCGNLGTKKKLLEQILFILDYDAAQPVYITEERGEKEFSLCCISYYSWYELDLIMAQKRAIEQLDGKNLHMTKKCGQKTKIRFHLFYYNIPLSNWYEPKETKAVLCDVNDETMVQLTLLLCKKEGVEKEYLSEIASWLDECKRVPEEDFLQKRKLTLQAIDLFREKKQEIVDLLQKSSKKENRALCEILIKGERRYESDQLLYLYHVLGGLDICHNHNSNQLMKLLSCAATLKAARGYEKIEGKPFFGCHANEGEVRLYQFLYSIYMLLEEPKLHAALSGGFLHEEHYYEALCRNRQVSYYLSPMAEHLLRM